MCEQLHKPNASYRYFSKRNFDLVDDVREILQRDMVAHACQYVVNDDDDDISKASMFTEAFINM